MSQESTRATLLARLRDPTDHAAWSAFEARYRDLILRYCARRGLQPADAEDVRQMVLLNLARQVRSFEYDPGKGRFRDYLGRTVQNAIHRLYRRPRPERSGLETSVLAQVPAEDAPELDLEWESEWREHHIRRAVDALRTTMEPRSLEIFEGLLAGDGVADVASSFGMSTDAVHKVKQRVRDRLRARIAEQIRDDEGLDRPA